MGLGCRVPHFSRVRARKPPLSVANGGDFRQSEAEGIPRVAGLPVVSATHE